MAWTIRYVLDGQTRRSSYTFESVKEAEAWKRTLLRGFPTQVTSAEVVVAEAPQGQAARRRAAREPQTLTACVLVIDALADKRMLKLEVEWRSGKTRTEMYQLHGKVGDWTLEKVGTEGEVYSVKAGACDCPDAKYRQRACKHVAALRQLDMA